MTATPHDASVPGSTVKWRITGSVSNSAVNTAFTVPDAYTFESNTQSIDLDDPCSDSSTLVVRTDGALGKFRGRVTIWLKGSQATNALTDLETVWRLIGPWNIAMPEGTKSMIAHPASGSFAKTNRGTHIEVQMGLKEV